MSYVNLIIRSALPTEVYSEFILYDVRAIVNEKGATY